LQLIEPGIRRRLKCGRDSCGHGDEPQLGSSSSRVPQRPPFRCPRGKSHISKACGVASLPALRETT
jgi:hypothetical protein